MKRPTSSREPGQRSRVGSVLLLLLLGLFVIAAAGTTFVFLNPPTALIRDQAIAAVKARTGRDLKITGPAQLTFYPALGVTMKNVSLSPPPGMTGAPTVAMESLDLSVKLLPLLSRKVEVSRLVLSRPKFDLRVDKSGRKSWDLAAIRPETGLTLRYAEVKSGTLIDALPQAARALAAGTNPPATAAPTAERLAALQDVVLHDIRIVDGAVAYTDETAGVKQSATSIDADLEAQSLTRPLSARGDLDWQGQTVRFDGTLTTLAELLTEKPAKLKLDIDAKPLIANYDGSIDTAKGATLDGNLTAKSGSMRALALWLGRSLPANEGFGPLSVTGRLKSQPGSFRLDNANIALDAMQVTGWISGVTTSSRPQIKADLKISELNLNTYLAQDGSAAATSQPAATLQPTAAPPAKPAVPPAAKPDSPPVVPATKVPASPHSIEDLLDRDAGPKVKGYTARAGWSDEPIDVALLDLVDADAKISLGKLFVRDIKVGQSDLQLTLANRIAKTTFERVALYDGGGRGTVTIDASGAQPAMAANLVVENVSAEPLMKDAAAIDWLSGKGKLTLATTARGNSQRQLVAALNGKATFAFSDGAIKGFNVGKALRGLQQGKLSELSTSPAEKTDFSELSASFDVLNGIATNQDLSLMSPLLRVSGDGRVDLPNRNVDYTARPKLVANISGQGGATGLNGLEVPLRITGSWHKPQIAPDLSKIDAKQAVQAVQEIGKRLKGKNAGEVVDEVFGKDSKESKKAKQFLDKLFR